ncbi:MAG: GAF domain-containing protein [Anaerolineae bacterium]|nr:GAF domain-containing protein [Anaerolineae bacterium]
MNFDFSLVQCIHRMDEMFSLLSQKRVTECEAFLDILAQFCVDNFGAAFARVWLADNEDKMLILKSSCGQYTRLDGSRAIIPIGQGSKIDIIYTSGEPHLTNDVLTDPAVLDKEWARREGMVSFAGYPLMWGDEKLGVLGMFARHALPADVLAAMGLFTKAVSAVVFLCQQTERNMRYFCEVTGFRRSLLEQLIRLGQKKTTA